MAVSSRDLVGRGIYARDGVRMGTANRSEWLTGWFVVGGIDDLATQPLKGLYKTQVRQLAAVLGVPAHVRSATPSPDMMKGITDETALGLSYPTIDLALDVLAGGISGEQAAAAGLTAEELRRVGQWTALAAWKRTPPAQPGRLPEPERSDLPPVDGGPTGGLRVMPATPP
jgi:NAD+ synthase